MAGNVNLVSSNIVPPAHEGDYTWFAEKKGSNIVLSGLVPSKSDRIRVAKRAKALNPKMGIINRMTVETGAASGFAPNTNKGLSLLSGLSNGVVSITNQLLSVSGTASSVNAYDILQNAMSGDLLAGFNWGKREITPSAITPYSWSIDKGDDQAVLGGFVPNRGSGKYQCCRCRGGVEETCR